MANALTTAQIATEFDTTPRTLRKFLRASDMGVGKGSRYALPGTKRDLAAMRKRFDAWIAATAKPVEADEADIADNDDDA